MEPWAWFCLYMAPFQLVALYLVWTIGRLSGWVEAKAESRDDIAAGVYSAGYPVAMVLLLLVVLPATVISGSMGLDDYRISWSVFGPVIVSLPLILLGWRTGRRRFQRTLPEAKRS